EVAPVIRAHELARLADERPRDHARDAVLLSDRSRRLAPGVQRREWHLLLVRGDLEDGIRARVDDGPSAGEMLTPQLLDDPGAAGGLVPEVSRRAGELQPFLHQLGRESLRERAEALLQAD